MPTTETLAPAAAVSAGADHVFLADNASVRVTSRGLLLAGSDTSAAHLAHQAPQALLSAITKGSSRAELATVLAAGDPDGPDPEGDRAPEAVEALLALGILADGRSAPLSPTEPRLHWDASGLHLPGVDRVAARIHRTVRPFLNPAALSVVAVFTLAGLLVMLSGRPAGPPVSRHPAADAGAGLLTLLLLGAAHELGHAVSLVHYGRRPRTAGMGFYWGSVCFFVDSTEALTLPQRARIIQALAGVATDAVAAAVLVGLAHLLAPAPLAAIAWRVAATTLLGVAVNAAPFLQLDGHLVLSDLLDEPELATQTAIQVDHLMHGRSPSRPWLALYGVAGRAFGVLLLVVDGYLWWKISGHLMATLVHGTVMDRATLVAVFGPTLLGLLLSVRGLLRPRQPARR